MVRVFGLSGLRNAYRSVLSAVGSSEIRGASRWLDAVPEPGARRATKSAASTAPTTASKMNAQDLRILRGSFLTAGRVNRAVVVAVVRGLIRARRRSGSVREGTDPVGSVPCLSEWGGRYVSKVSTMRTFVNLASSQVPVSQPRAPA